MSDDPHALKLYIDGNCYQNAGGAGAIACVAIFPKTGTGLMRSSSMEDSTKRRTISWSSGPVYVPSNMSPIRERNWCRAGLDR
jgi:hypothetical protein